MLTTPCDRPTPYGKKHSLGHHTQKVSNSPVRARTCFFLESVADTHSVWQVFWLVLPLSRPSRTPMTIFSDHETDCGCVCDELTAAGLRRTFTVLPF